MQKAYLHTFCHPIHNSTNLSCPFTHLLTRKSQYTDVLNSIQDLLSEERVTFVRIDGSTSQAQRTERVAQFQEDDVTDVALLSIKVREPCLR